MPGVGVNRTGGGSVVQAISSQFNSTLSWADIAWLRGIWPHTLVTKGIMSGADAERAIDAGADGVIVSNHGGRQLGSAPATVDVLPEVVAAVGARVPVVVDGGIRRGTDVLTALALGARAVQIGRPYLFGLAHGGQRGVELVLDILARELDRSLALSGHCSIDQLDGIGLARRPVDRPR
jgi:isopentenyl diphosphate isomerase/L-lactate dehydrogenase-like FMN-dependent dehydrogenase